MRKVQRDARALVEQIDATVEDRVTLLRERDEARAEVERLRADLKASKSMHEDARLLACELHAEVERLREQVTRLQSQIADWHEQNRPLCEVKDCKRMATGEVEQANGFWWRVCDRHHAAAESTGEERSDA